MPKPSRSMTTTWKTISRADRDARSFGRADRDARFVGTAGSGMVGSVPVLGVLAEGTESLYRPEVEMTTAEGMARVARARPRAKLPRRRRGRWRRAVRPGRR